MWFRGVRGGVGGVVVRRKADDEVGDVGA